MKISGILEVGKRNENKVRQLKKRGKTEIVTNHE
jgi:hypothetical protein